MSTGLILHTSNRLENLADDLGCLFEDPLASFLAPEIVIVQSHGMERWLSQQLAMRQEICANVNFCFPQKFFEQLLSDVLPEKADSRLYQRDTMTWRIFDLLPGLKERTGFASVAHYLQRDGGDLRLFQLARRVARSFDQYVVFRPELILAWDRGSDNNWQAVLWRELGPPDEPSHHLATLAQKLVRAFPRAKRLPARISIFGISSLPPLYVQLFEQLARFIPVHMFVLQPTDAWWGDVETERERLRKAQPDLFDPPATEQGERINPLLAENSKLGRDFLHLLFDCGEIQHWENFVRPMADHALEQVQRDIFDFEKRPPSEQPQLTTTDCSLQFHSCYSHIRELEVLQNQLLALFDRDPSLLPKDILVMMPDVSSYASFIDAVFSEPDDKEHFIPYRIADRSARAANGAIDAFLRLLELLPGRIRTTDVFALLESAAVQRRFGITAGDLGKLRAWSQKAGARWGMDAAHRAELGLSEFGENSWRQAIDRMLLGYALPPRHFELFQGIAPFGEIEGADAELAGQFIDFLERLFARARAFAGSFPLAQWSGMLLELVDEFLEGENSDERELGNLRSAITRLEEIAGVINIRRPVSLSAIKLQLEESLAESRTGAGFLSGALTFCSLKPMRSIPCRVICLLGLNDTAYPRRDHVPGFDLIAQQPRRGDRSARADDRALFLEALLSARDVFYLSYLGCSVRDNKPLPPSVLASELIDYVEERFAIPSGTSVVQHPLQSFSPRNFDGSDARVFSYTASNLAAAETLRQERRTAPPFCPEPLPEDDERELTLEELEDFLVNPPKFFLRNRLQIRLPRDEETLEDDEPFGLEGLPAYNLDQALLKEALRGDEFSADSAAIRAQQILPAGEAGEKFFARKREQIGRFAAAIRPLIKYDSAVAFEIKQSLGNFHLTGRVEEIRNGVLLRYRLARLKPKDYLRAWVRHLARNLVDPGETHLFGFDEEVMGFRFVSLRPENACAELEKLFELYRRGRREPLRFFPESSWNFVETMQGSASGSEIEKARQGWNGNDRQQVGGDKRDAFIAFAFGNEDEPLNSDWEETSRRILDPLFEAMEKIQ